MILSGCAPNEDGQNKVKERAPVNVIFDTDIGSDCDDAGAMAVLHKLADKGEINILGTIFSSNANKYGIGTIAAINKYYGRPELPLGQLQSHNTVGDPGDSYTKYIAEATAVYGHSVVDSASELVQSYTNILREQPNKSVVIVTVGHPVGIFALLNDKTAYQLVNQKVLYWVAMTHADTNAMNDWNFGKNGSASYIREILALWPTEVYFSALGKDIITGNKELPNTDAGNPVKKAYELWGNNALEHGRSSWDQIAVLFAARPDLFRIEHGTLIQNKARETYWSTVPINKNHFRVSPKMDDKKLASLIEGLMGERPGLSK